VTGAPTPADARLVRRAGLVVAAQTAAAVAVVVGCVAVLVLVLTGRAQHANAERVARTAATSAQSVARPPVGVVLLIRGTDGRLAVSPGAPAAMSSIDVSHLPTGLSTIEVPLEPEDPADLTPFQVYTLNRNGQRVAAALDISYQRAETQRLVTSLLVAGLIGVVAAAAVGWLIGIRTVRPLSRALALQRQFVTDASHELRTPLSILHTRAQVIGRRTDVDARTRADLQRLAGDAQVLGEIINDLLLSAELQQHPEIHELVDLGILAHEVVDNFTPAADGRRVRLTAETSGEPVVVAGVPIALRRAINALTDNALGHTPAAGNVTITVTKHATTATIAVTDTGEGIDPAQAGDLLDRFARAPHAPGRGHRFGLGLALVREIVQAHGGTIKLTGQPGKGAIATITLPLSPSPAA
jgi:two-component system, OmpR family, sensor kinase